MFLGSLGNRWDKHAFSFVALAGLATLGTIVWRRKRREDGLDATIGWDENDYFSDMVSSLSEAQLRKAIEMHGLPQDLIHSQAHYIHNNGSDDFVVRLQDRSFHRTLGRF